MKVLTWNLERLHRNKNNEILSILKEIDADIIVLTETDSTINPGAGYYNLETTQLPIIYDGVKYTVGENRTSVYSKYPIYNTIQTFDNYTSVCGLLDTPIGDITIYGGIIGVFGGKGERFNADFKSTLIDLENIKGPIIFAGDFNITTTGYTYPSIKARNQLAEILSQKKMLNLTSKIENHVCHIAVSNTLVTQKYNVTLIDENKTLSDHMGVWVDIT